jgi:hypothetical protein
MSSILGKGRNRRRVARRFRPGLGLADDAGTILDQRLLLSAGLEAGVLRAHAAARAHAVHPAKADHPAARLRPAAEINTQYAAFLANFRAVEQYYVQALSEPSTGTVAVSATVTAPYAAGSPTMQVSNATVFGPSGTFPRPITATASVGTTPIGSFVLNGSSGNQLIVNPSLSSAIPLNIGTVISANVPVSSALSAAMIFPNYIAASTNQLAVTLVRYFNSLPLKLPRKFAFPHQSSQTGAIQQLVFELVDGDAATSLAQVLVAIPLPTTPESDLNIYDAAVASAVNASRINVLDSVAQVYAGTLPVVPSNLVSTTSSTSSTSGTGSSSSSGGTSSGSA